MKLRAGLAEQLHLPRTSTSRTLAYHFGTDKSHDDHKYTDLYSMLFEPLRDCAKRDRDWHCVRSVTVAMARLFPACSHMGPGHQHIADPIADGNLPENTAGDPSFPPTPACMRCFCLREMCRRPFGPGGVRESASANSAAIRRSCNIVRL